MINLADWEKCTLRIEGKDTFITINQYDFSQQERVIALNEFPEKPHVSLSRNGKKNKVEISDEESDERE